MAWCAPREIDLDILFQAFPDIACGLISADVGWGCASLISPVDILAREPGIALIHPTSFLLCPRIRGTFSLRQNAQPHQGTFILTSKSRLNLLSLK